ncbi:MAG: polysaccharide biosynthesis/export family protein [bacterium]
MNKELDYRLFFILGVSFLFTILAGCVKKGISPNLVDNLKAEKILNEYQIQPGDTLLIDILENTNTSRTVNVRPDGKISLPQLNDIQAAGLTALKLRENLIEQFKKFYNVVEITVTVTNNTGYKVIFIGNVNNPGQLILKDKTTFLEAISLAGGLSEWAKTGKIYIVRDIQRINLDYDKVLEGKERDIWILPGDIIVVP